MSAFWKSPPLHALTVILCACSSQPTGVDALRPPDINLDSAMTRFLSGIRKLFEINELPSINNALTLIYASGSNENTFTVEEQGYVYFASIQSDVISSGSATFYKNENIGQWSLSLHGDINLSNACITLPMMRNAIHLQVFPSIVMSSNVTSEAEQIVTYRFGGENARRSAVTSFNSSGCLRYFIIRIKAY